MKSPANNMSMSMSINMSISPAAEDSASTNVNKATVNNETTMEVIWNPAEVCADLQRASQILSERCLKHASKWAIEQWMGLPPDVVIAHSHGKTGDNGTGAAGSTIPDEYSLSGSGDDHNPAISYAKCLMELGEYQHAAATLSEPSLSKAKVESMPAPLGDLSPFGFYLRAYALYMAGERRREEDYLELKGGAQKYAPSVNPYLQQLSCELLDAYEAGILDPFGLHVYGMVLKAGQKTVLPATSPAPQTVLMRSILMFPYNWSAWLDLAELALDNPRAEREIEEHLQPAMAGHFMYHFFCAHLQTEHQAHPEALQLYERWMDPSLFGGSPYLLTQYAVVQYHLREFSSAKRLLEDLHDHMPYRLDSMDVYSNILYVQEDSVTLSHLAHTAVQVDKYRAETCVIVGNYYSLKQMRAKAIQYFNRALKVDRSFTSAWTLMGHEYVEWKQTANAIEAYRRAVQVSPMDYRAWYGLGQTYEFLNMHMHALYYYKRAVQLRPYDARMWCALGTTFAQLHRTADAIRAYERALQQGDTEGVATQKLAALYKQEDHVEKAAQCYLRHLEVRYQVTHPPQHAAHAAAAAAAEGQGDQDQEQQPVNLETMLQGIVLESTEAEAILFLAQYHKEQDEYETAVLFCSRLLEYPGPEKEEAKALLRELRSRTTAASAGQQQRQRQPLPRRVIHTRSKGPVRGNPSL